MSLQFDETERIGTGLTVCIARQPIVPIRQTFAGNAQRVPSLPYQRQEFEDFKVADVLSFIDSRDAPQLHGSDSDGVRQRHRKTHRWQPVPRPVRLLVNVGELTHDFPFAFGGRGGFRFRGLGRLGSRDHVSLMLQS